MSLATILVAKIASSQVNRTGFCNTLLETGHTFDMSNSPNSVSCNEFWVTPLGEFPIVPDPVFFDAENACECYSHFQSWVQTTDYFSAQLVDHYGGWQFNECATGNQRCTLGYCNCVEARNPDGSINPTQCAPFPPPTECKQGWFPKRSNETITVFSGFSATLDASGQSNVECSNIDELEVIWYISSEYKDQTGLEAMILVDLPENQTQAPPNATGIAIYDSSMCAYTSLVTNATDWVFYHLNYDVDNTGNTNVSFQACGAIMSGNCTKTEVGSESVEFATFKVLNAANGAAEPVYFESVFYGDYSPVVVSGITAVGAAILAVAVTSGTSAVADAGVEGTNQVLDLATNQAEQQAKSQATGAVCTSHVCPVGPNIELYNASKISGASATVSNV